MFNEVFTFTGVGKSLSRPGELYSEEAAHSTASTMNERPTTQEGMGEDLWLKMSTKIIYRSTAACQNPRLFVLSVDFRLAFEH